MQCVQFRFVTPIAESIIAEEREREREKKEGKTDSGKSIFLPASSVPVPAILILPARRPHHHVCTVVSVVPPFHHLSVCHSAALIPQFLILGSYTSASVPHLQFLNARNLHRCFHCRESTQFHKALLGGSTRLESCQGCSKRVHVTKSPYFLPSL